MANRDVYFDSMKFVLIALVIFGHTLEQFGNIETNRLSLTTYFSIYSFHMPLFVFISGYFTSPFKTKTAKSVLKIFETFVVFQLVRLTLNGDWSFSNIMTPQWTLWYLLSLCFWKLGTLILPPPTSSKTLCINTIMAFVFVSLCAGFVDIDTELSFQRTFNLFPFFLIGYYAKNNNLVEYIRSKHRYLSALLFGTVVLSIFLLNKPLYSLLMFQSTPLLGQVFWKVISLCICIIMSGLIINLMPTINGKIAKYGQCTLLFYIAHTFLIQILHQFDLPNGFFVSIVYALLVTIVLMLVSRIKGIEKCLNPVSSIIKFLRG